MQAEYNSTYELNFVETTEDTTMEAQRAFDSDGSINNVLNNILDFIRAVGFTWANQLIVVTDNGTEHSSNVL